MDGCQLIRGLTFPPPQFFTKQNIEDTLDYVPHDGDIVLASYPKSGTTWLQYIVLQIISKGEHFPSMDALNKICPFVELVGTRYVEELKEPRVYMHHCPYNMVKKNQKAKYIYIYRNPDDVFVSYFHFLQERRGCSLDFERHFQGFLSGNIGYGRCFEHVLSYWQHKDDDNLLLVSYEKLLNNRKEEILKITKFLGQSYHQAILSDESALENILEHTSFDYMKRNLKMFNTNPSKNDGHSEREVNQINFFRKGVIGDGKRSLSRDQLKRLRKVMEDVLEGTTLLEEWTNP